MKLLLICLAVSLSVFGQFVPTSTNTAVTPSTSTLVNHPLSYTTNLTGNKQTPSGAVPTITLTQSSSTGISNGTYYPCQTGGTTNVAGVVDTTHFLGTTAINTDYLVYSDGTHPAYLAGHYNFAMQISQGIMNVIGVQ